MLLQARVGYHIEYALIALVTNTCYDRYGEVGYVLCQCKSVEAAHVAGGTASADDDDAVVIRVINALKGVYDTLFYTFALHGGGE